MREVDDGMRREPGTVATGAVSGGPVWCGATGTDASTSDAMVAPPVDDPYPIRLHRGECPVNDSCDGCVLVDNLRQRWCDLQVNGSECAAREWAKVPHPTLRTRWVVPLECEPFDRRRFSTVAAARREVFGFIQGSYNTRRPNSALGYESPVNFAKLNHAA